MSILETIPIYETPTWPGILALIGLGLIVVGMTIIADTDYAGIVALVVGLIIFLVGIGLLFILNNTEYSHDEYIVKIDSIPTKEFVEHYDVTKRFEYSDVVQVREITK